MHSWKRRGREQRVRRYRYILSPRDGAHRCLGDAVSKLTRKADCRRTPLTNADSMRTIRSVGAAMSALSLEKALDFAELFGATRRIRTDDLLITNCIC
jgi:hypothetical protein